MISINSAIDTLLFLACHLASMVLLCASAWLIGETVLRRLAIDHPRRHWALAGTLGWGLILQTLFFLGVLGLLQRWIVLGLLALAHLVCLGTWRSVFAAQLRPDRLPRGRLRRLLAIGGAIAIPLFALTLYPPTGFDATVYHLPYAHAFVEAGGLEFLPDLRFPIFPQAGELGFVLGFFLSGDIAAKLTQLLAILLTAGLVLDWGRLYGRRTGVWAAALWFGNPLIVWLGASAYVDATLALFVTAALFSWERWVRNDDLRWLWLAGGFAGLAAGTKYLGLFFVAALGIMTVWRALKVIPAGGRRDAWRAKPAMVLAAGAVVVLAPWYLRIVYHTGSPVFPFYAPIFGASEWTSLHDQALPAADAGANTLWTVVASQMSRIFEGLTFLAKVPWTAVFDRGIFHWQAPLSPWYMVLLPLIAPFALLERRSRRLVVLALVYSLFWLTTVRDLRFLIVCMPALNVALAATLAGPTRPGRWLLALDRRTPSATPLLAVLLLAPGVLYAGYKMVEQGWPPVDAEQRRAYLSRQVPGYRAIATMNDLQGDDYTVYALYGENLRYYAKGRFLGDWFGPARYSRIEPLLDDASGLADELERMGACFFLLRHLQPHPRLPTASDVSRYFTEQAVGDDFILYRLPEVGCANLRNQRSAAQANSTAK